jgi:hypothetical protein
LFLFELDFDGLFFHHDHPPCIILILPAALPDVTSMRHLSTADFTLFCLLGPDGRPSDVVSALTKSQFFQH